MKRTFADHVWRVLLRDNGRPKSAREIALLLHVGPERVRPLLRRWFRNDQLYETIPLAKARARGARHAYGIKPSSART